MQQDKEVIDNLRLAMGTLPSSKPAKQTRIISLQESLEVSIEDSSENPYRGSFSAACATWGDNNYLPKWPLTSKEGRLEVVKAILTHSTLPQAKEMIYFVFRIKGVPRKIFEYHTHVPFISIMSIGTRDNQKLDADIVKQHTESDEALFSELKDLYQIALSDDMGSFQTARSFLPQSYSHSYILGQNLLSIVGTKGFHASRKLSKVSYEEAALYIIYQAIQVEIEKKFPLLGMYCNILFMKNEDVFEQIRNLTYDVLDERDKRLFESC